MVPVGENWKVNGFLSPYAHISGNAPGTPTNGLSDGMEPSEFIRNILPKYSDRSGAFAAL